MNQEKLNINIQDLISINPKVKKEKTNIYQNYLVNNFEVLREEFKNVEELNTLIEIKNKEELEEYKCKIESHLENAVLLEKIAINDILKRKIKRYCLINEKSDRATIIDANSLTILGFLIIFNIFCFVIDGFNINIFIAIFLSGLMAFFTVTKILINNKTLTENMGKDIKILWMRWANCEKDLIDQEIKKQLPTSSIAQSIYKELMSKNKSKNANTILLRELYEQEQIGNLTWMKFVKNPKEIEEIKDDILKKMLRAEKLENSIKEMIFLKNNMF